MKVQTRRSARESASEAAAQDETAVQVPLIDVPEWVEAGMQFLSFGAYTPRSAERRALEEAARASRDAAEATPMAELDFTG